MSKHHKRRPYRQSARGTSTNASAIPSFTPVPVSPRHDGWTPLRQDAFIKALAETAHVEEACAAVGMSPRSAYTLRARGDATSFRQAWDAALDLGVHRLADAMLGRALRGVATPIFYKGEQVGERRHYDERLAMFILRARDPSRYGKWRDSMQVHRQHPDGAARVLGHALRALREDTRADEQGRPRPIRAPLKMERLLDDPAEQLAIEEEVALERERAMKAKHDALMRTLDVQTESGVFDDGWRIPEAGSNPHRRATPRTT
ncbi:MAG TPA: hypothetical protein VF695_09300 [Sphingomonas sp.]|jgi:hypothetical protein